MYLDFPEIGLNDDNDKFFFITDANWTIKSIPSVCQHISNYSADKFINKLHYSELFKADYKNEIEQKVLSTIEKKGKQTNSLLVQFNEQIKNNSFQLNIIIIYNENGDFSGLFGVIDYSTEMLNEMLGNFKKEHHQLINNIPLGIYRTTIDGSVIFANKTLIEIFHYESPKEFKKININNLFVESEYRSVAINQWVNAENYCDEFQAYTKEKEIIWVKDEGKVIKDNKGNVLYFDGILEDISLEKKADEKRKTSELKLKELNISKDKFFSIISHDLKAPFGQFISATQLILDRIDEFEKTQIEKLINLLNQQAQQSYKLLENLLEWSKNQRGLIKYEPKPLSLGNLINEIIQGLDQMATNKTISVNSSIQSSLIIYADKDMLSSILRNLISNAVKFTEEKGNITISKSFIIPEDPLDEKILEISVTDSGIGIRKEEIDKLFKIDTAFSTRGTQRESGTGLGLILCKDFVEKHGGQIHVESEPGKGSSFKFTLP
ncbi:MAG: hypothetical protein DRJ10_17620 [Bacteroidetes bacterium]|nr:MAG: hypothetical protein DRJ10_17620 [Bacteroidota bacterium]